MAKQNIFFLQDSFTVNDFKCAFNHQMMNSKWFITDEGSWFNINMLYHQYKKSHWGDKAIWMTMRFPPSVRPHLYIETASRCHHIPRYFKGSWVHTINMQFGEVIHMMLLTQTWLNAPNPEFTSIFNSSKGNYCQMRSYIMLYIACNVLLLVGSQEAEYLVNKCSDSVTGLF